MTFVSLEVGLKFDDFSMGFWAHPRSCDRAWWKANVWFLGSSNNNSRIPATDSRVPETEAENLEIELRVHRIHDTLESGLRMIPRSLMAPTRGAGGLHKFDGAAIQQYSNFLTWS